MKRVVGSEMGRSRVPDRPVAATRVRSLFADTEDEWESGCWQCPDSPCTKWSTTELEMGGPDIGAVDSTKDVCPTGALTIDGEGRPQLESDQCIGCGICVVRCPVDAIRIDASSMRARIAPSYWSSPETPTQFYEERSRAQAGGGWPSRPWVDADRVSDQVRRLETVFEDYPPLAFQGMRLLLRNALLLGGVPAKLRKRGANSAVVEVAGEFGEAFLVAQVESSSDTLDPFRRLLVGLANLLGRQRYERGELIPAVVILRLPNARADYFRLVVDARKYLDVRIRTVPAAWILLAVRDGGLTPETVRAIPVSEEGSEGLSAGASAFFGSLVGASSGLDPRK